MKFKKMGLINFSDGIKSEEVMANDLALQNQIERERVAVAGYGISFGLELELDEFNLKVTTGTIIDKDGVEKIINEKNLKIEKPHLSVKKELLYLNENGAIKLSDIPYSENGYEISEKCKNKNFWGITAYYEDEPNNELEIVSIEDNYIYIKNCDRNRAIVVTYNIAFDRIDTIYIDNDYNIEIAQGIDSTSPAAYNIKNYKYILGFIKIISKHYDEKTGEIKAKAEVIKELTNRRTVYTDTANNLYLCGIPFESLLRIYFDEPKKPKEGMIWYDMTTNLLKIYRRTDNFMFTDIVTYEYPDINPKQKISTSVGYYKSQLNVYIQNRDINGNNIWTKLKDEEINYYSDLKESEKNNVESTEFEIVPKIVSGTVIRYSINRYDNSYYWVPMNSTSYINCMEYKMWAPDEDEIGFVNYLPGLNINEMKKDRNNHDLKTFFFGMDEISLRFTPHKNELDLIIDQMPLHRDQFVEITAKDAVNSKELMDIAKEYGYSSDYLNNLLHQYQDIGIGFKLINKLDRVGYVEANITHRVNDSILKNKLQRTACFVKNGTFVVDPSMIVNGKIKINTEVPYKVGEEQIEVFKNGLKISNLYIEEEGSINNVLGKNSNSFSLDTNMVNISVGDTIDYKILTNVYTYDNVISVLTEYTEELRAEISDLNKTVKKLYNKVQEINGGPF